MNKTLPMLLGLLPVLAQAQGQPPAVPPVTGTPAKTGVAALPQPGGALLRWSLPGDLIPDGYRLTREGGGETVTRTLGGAVPKEEAVRNGWVTGQQYDFLRARYGAPVSDPFEKFSLQLQLLADSNLARTLNLLVTERGLKDGVKYSYRVTALRGGREVPVGTAVVTPGAAPAVPTPGNLKATPERTRVTLGWAAPGGLVMAYRVYRAEGDGPARLLQPSPYFPTVDAAQPAAVLFKDDTGDIRPKTRYTYQVTALDLFGREGPRSAALVADTSVAERFARASLQEPQIRFGADGRGSVTLTWNAVADPRIRGLVVYRGERPESLQPLADVAAGAGSYTDGTVEEARSYVYGLGYRLEGGPTGPLSIRGAQPLNPAPPPAPTGLTAELKDARTARLAWQPVAGALGYLVVRGASADTPADALVAVTPQPVRAAALSVPLDAAPGTGLSFRVIAVSASGVAGPPSPPATAEVPRVGGDAPALEAVEPAPGALRLSWSYPDAAPATAEVFRRNPDGTLVLVARLPGSAQTFEDRQVQAPFVYGYLVAGVDARGVRGTPSNVKAAAPQNLAATPKVSGLKAQPAPGQTAPGQTGTALSWQASGGGAAGYAVYRVRAGQTERLGVALAPGFTDAQGRAGDLYRVTPLEAGGVQGDAAEVTRP